MFAEKIIHTQVNAKPNQTKQKVTVFEQKQTNKLQYNTPTQKRIPKPSQVQLNKNNLIENKHTRTQTN